MNIIQWQQVNSRGLTCQPQHRVKNTEVRGHTLLSYFTGISNRNDEQKNLESPEERLCAVIFSLKAGHLLDWSKVSTPGLCSSSAPSSGFDS